MRPPSAPAAAEEPTPQNLTPAPPPGVGPGVRRFQPVPAPNAASTGDPVSAQLANLVRLGELKAAGVLSDAEFEAKKAQILGS